MLQKTDEALDAAEQGRAQALQDALEIKYGFPSFPHRCNKSEEEFTNTSRKVSTLTAFLAIQNETINLWVLGKESNAVFRQAKLTMENVHEDSFAALLEASLKKNRCWGQCKMRESVVGQGKRQSSSQYSSQ